MALFWVGGDGETGANLEGEEIDIKLYHQFYTGATLCL